MTGAHQKELAEAGISLARDDARQIAMRDTQHQTAIRRRERQLHTFWKN